MSAILDSAGLCAASFSLTSSSFPKSEPSASISHFNPAWLQHESRAASCQSQQILHLDLLVAYRMVESPFRHSLYNVVLSRSSPSITFAASYSAQHKKMLVFSEVCSWHASPHRPPPRLRPLPTKWSQPPSSLKLLSPVIWPSNLKLF